MLKLPWLASAMLLSSLPASLQAAPVEWPSYNRTLSSERFVPLAAIDTRNARTLKVICTYDTREVTSFQSGLVEIGGALYGTTEHDTFSIDPNNCRQNWRAHEEFPSDFMRVNRGVAVLDGRVFRGTADGRVIAYSARSGKRLWSTTIADGSLGESVPSAPIAWEGLVFAGNAGGDRKGGRGHMYALEAATGRIVWEFYLVPRTPADEPLGPVAPGAPAGAGDTWKNSAQIPISGGGTWTSYSLDPSSGLLYVPGGNPAPDFVRTVRAGNNLYTDSVVVLDARSGAYRRHFQLVRHDFHDWDVSSPPVLFTSCSGKRMMVVAPKDGHLYGFDLSDHKLVYRRAVTTVFQPDAPLGEQGTRFCPGSLGGGEWNGPALDPALGLIFTGEADWCTTVRTEDVSALRGSAPGRPWTGSSDGFGSPDAPPNWSGWLTASNAVTGAIRWRFRAAAPILSGVTPTGGNLVLFGDLNGNFYVFDAASGKPLWIRNLHGAIGGGVISYDTGAGQKIAVAAGMSSPLWPTPRTRARIVILGL